MPDNQVAYAPKTVDELLHGPPPPLDPKAQKDYAPSTVNEMLHGPAPPVLDTKISKTGLTSEPHPGYGNWITRLQDDLTVSAGSFSASSAGINMMFRPDYTMEDADRDVQTKELTKAQMDITDYNNQHQYVDLLKDARSFNWSNAATDVERAASDVGGFLVQNAPQMGLQALSSPLGAGIGAMVGGVGGPAAAKAGSIVGGMVAPAMLNGSLAAGSHMYEYRKAGVEYNTAKGGAIVTGASAATATLAGLGLYSKLLPGVANLILKSGGFRQAAGALAQRLAVATGVNTSVQALQSGVDAWADYLAMHAEENPPGVAAKFSLEDATRKFWQQLGTSALAGVALEGGVTALGVHAGLTTITSKMRAAEAEIRFERTEAIRKAKEAAAKQQAETTRQQGAAETTAERQASSDKRGGHLNAEHKSSNVQAAEHAVEVAEAKLKLAPKEEQARARLSLAIAKARLQQAKFNAKIKALQAAYNDPNLTGNLTNDKRMLKAKIETFEEELAKATTQTEQDHWKAAITRATKELSDVQELLNLGKEEAVKKNLAGKIEALKIKGQATKKQIAQTTLEQRIADRKIEIKKLEGEVKAENDVIAGIEKQNKLSNLNLAQDVDQMLHGNIEADQIFKLEDLVDETIAKPAISVRSLVNRAKDMVEQVGNKSAALTRQHIAGAQKLLEGAIQASRLAGATKKALIAKIQAYEFAKGKAEFFELVKTIEAALDAESKARALKEVKNLTGAIKENMRLRTQKPGTFELLAAIRDFAKDPTVLFDYVASTSAQQTPLSPLQQGKLDLATKLFGKTAVLEKMSRQELQEIARTIISLDTEGTSKATQFAEERAARQAENKRQWVDAQTPTQRGQARLTQAHRLIRGALTKYQAFALENWDASMMAATQFGKITNFASRMNFSRAFSKYLSGVNEWNAKFEGALSDAGVTVKGMARFLKKSQEHAGILKYDYVDAEGVLHGGVDLAESEVNSISKIDDRKGFTLGELVDIALKMDDTEASITNRFQQGNKFSYKGEVAAGRSTQEVIEAKLDADLPGWRQVGQAIKNFYQLFHEPVAQLAQVAYGRELERNPTYGGAASHEIVPGGIHRELVRRTTLTAGSTFSRVMNDAPVKIVDAVDGLKAHIRHNIRELNLYELTGDAHALFLDPKVAGATRQLIGDRTQKNIEHFINRVLLEQQRIDDQADSFAQTLMKNLYASALSLNPAQLASQLTGAVNIFQTIGVKAAYEGWAFMLADPKEAERMINLSGKIETRLKEVTGRDRDQFNNGLMGAVSVGDQGSVQLSFPILLDAFIRTGDMEHAVDTYERYVDMTQSTGSKDMLPPMFTSGPWTKFVTAMSSEGTLQTGTVLNEYRLWRSTGDSKYFRSWFYKSTVIWSAAAAYNWAKYAMLYPFMPDNQKEERAAATADAMIAGPLGNIAGLGGLFTHASVQGVNIVKNEHTKAWDVQMLPTDPAKIGGQTIDSVAAVFRSSGDKAWALVENGAKLADLKTGWPVSRITRTVGTVIGAKQK